MYLMDMLQRRFRAPEIYGDFWFNSDPIPLGALRGYTILIQFWDYTCLTCLRTLPYLKEWHRKYQDMGVHVIGVHTPEYPFGRDPVSVRNAIEKERIRYPVVMDNDFLIWGAFRNRVWPTSYLIDRDGFIRIVHEGEGSYLAFEQSLQALLAESGYHGEFPLLMEYVRETDRPGAMCFRITPEIHGGYQRGNLGNVEGYLPEGTSHFDDPGYHLEGRMYLHGNWKVTRNFWQLDDHEGTGGHAILVYQAKEVNAILKPEGEKNFQVFVKQNDQYLTQENKGSDVHLDAEGRSYLLVDGARLYNIVRNAEFGQHTLKLSSYSSGFLIYSVSFVSCLIPELVAGN